MGHWDKSRACDWIEGYYFPLVSDPAQHKRSRAFKRAKNETIKNMKKYLRDIEEIEEEDFFRIKRLL